MKKFKIFKMLLLASVFVFGIVVLSCTKEGAVGPQGTKGDKGDQGETGQQGLAGTNGINGTNGTNGLNGATGPQGSAGTNGTNGTDGTNGTNGINGTNGNANVQNYSITVSPLQWTYDNLYKRWYYRYYTSIAFQSAVLGYVMSGSGEQAIPYYQHDPSPGIQFDMATYLFGTPPYIEFQYTNYSSLTTAPTADTYLYIVALPPAMIISHPNVDFKNYDEVKRVLNLN